MGILLTLLNIVVSGNIFFPKDSILKVFKSSPEEVLNIYKEQGFLQIKLKVLEDSLLIEEGPQFKIGYITLTGNTVFAAPEILDSLDIKTNEIFNEFNFKEDIELILRKYEDSGYPFCKVIPCNFQFRADTVDFEFNIKEGELVKIANIRVEGNETTREYVILRELALKQGDKFCESKIKKSEGKIRKLKFIDSVNINLIGKDELVVNVKEAKVNRLEGIIGYKKDEIIGLFELEILNLFGTGRTLNISWDRPYKTFNSLELGYKEPWLFGHRITLEGNFSYITEDTFYTKKRGELILSVPLTIYLSANTGVCGVWVQGETKYSGIVGLDFDTKSRPGYHYQAKGEFNLNEIERVLLNADNEILLPVARPFRVAFPQLFLFASVNYYTLFNKNPPLYDKFKLGGAKTLRGYWENEFVGTEIGWLNLELRKFIGNSFIFPFYDIASIDSEIKRAYGVGIAANTPIGLIKVAYGIGNKMNFMEGKIHILLETRF